MTSFQDFSLNPDILKALDEIGFETPTPVQEAVLTQFFHDQRDIVALAQTGTGKTAAFSLPVLQSIDTKEKVPQVIILSPTRELAIQIGKDLEAYSKYMKGVKSTVVYGGTSIMDQIRTLKKGVNIVIGTPGRTIDLIKRRKLDLSNVGWVVLDEADEMLSMGFKEDLEFILSKVPDEHFTFLFSATLAKEIKKISKKYLNNPLEITIGSRNAAATNVEHQYGIVHRRDKYQALKRVLDVNPDIYSIIFCRTRAETNEIAGRLSEDGYNADVLNGDLSQSQRDGVMKRFRDRHLQILVATDVAARGLDVQDLTHVIHYQLPDDTEVYVHRSGRTGRAGKSGKSIALIIPNDRHKVSRLERVVGKPLGIYKIPSGEEICKQRLFSFVSKLKNIDINTGQIADLLPIIKDQLDDMSKEDLISRLVHSEFSRFLEYYDGAVDINVEPGKNSSRGVRNSKNGKRDKNRDRSGRKEGNFSRYFINLGKKHKANPKELINLVNQTIPVRNIEIGQIEVLKDFSFIELDKEYEATCLRSFDGTKYKGYNVTLEVAQQKGSKRRGAKKGGRRKNRKK